MIARPTLVAVVLAAVLGALALAGCGTEHEEAVVEGEPVEVGDLSYNVQLTRFLNPGDPEDAAYLEGVPPAPRGTQYLGVFMIVENEGSEPARLPTEMEVTDTRAEAGDGLVGHGQLQQGESDYALKLGSELAPGEELPQPGTTAASGPIRGAMVLFQVEADVTENRPLELEIPGEGGESGHVELDI